MDGVAETAILTRCLGASITSRSVARSVKVTVTVISIACFPVLEMSAMVATPNSNGSTIHRIQMSTLRLLEGVDGVIDLMQT